MSYIAFLRRKVTKPPSAGQLLGKIPQRKQTVKPKRRTLAPRLNILFASDLHGRAQRPQTAASPRPHAAAGQYLSWMKWVRRRGS